MTKIDKRRQTLQRAKKTHAISRSTSRPRLIVFRSNKTIYAQICNDEKGIIVCSASGLKSKLTGIKMAEEVGKKIAKKALTKKITEISFDRNGYKYHGQVKALADSARAAGLSF